METEPHRIPRIAINSIATGLLMMAFFTTMWAGIASGGLTGFKKGAEIGFFSVLIISFIVYSLYFFSASKRFPKLRDEADKARGQKEGMWFGIIFGAEGLGIFIAINIVRNLAHDDLIIPIIALVVGLHFYPMAKIFKRTIDYYVATWSTIIAVLGIIFTLNKGISPENIAVFVGIGMAASTSCYGLYMIVTGRGFLRRVPIDVQAAVL